MHIVNPFYLQSFCGPNTQAASIVPLPSANQTRPWVTPGMTQTGAFADSHATARPFAFRIVTAPRRAVQTTFAVGWTVANVVCIVGGTFATPQASANKHTKIVRTRLRHFAACNFFMVSALSFVCKPFADPRPNNGLPAWVQVCKRAGWADSCNGLALFAARQDDNGGRVSVVCNLPAQGRCLQVVRLLVCKLLQ